MITSLVLTLLAAQSSTPILVEELNGSIQGGNFGAAALDMGDLDGDGIRDWAVGSPFFPPSQPLSYSSGRVEIISGATLLPLYHLDADPDAFEIIGEQLLNLGDLDGDGKDDLLISGNGPANAYVVSGVDGAFLYRIPAQGVQTASSYTIIEDVNGDQLPEIAIGFWAESYHLHSTGELMFQAGLIKVIDGATGSRIFEVRGQHDFQGLGSKVLGAGDLDGDGVGDVISMEQGFGLGNFKLRAFSGTDGHALYTVGDERINTVTEISLAMLDDFDGDGTPDLMLSGHTFENAAGNATGFTSILSGRNGTELHRILGRSYLWPGNKASQVGDVNGDGLRDFAVGQPLAVNGIDHFSVHVFSGADASLLAIIDTGDPEYWGHSLSATSDQDGDGIDDLMIGIPNASAGSSTWYGYGALLIYALH